jgi:hypothetical protein
MKETTRLTEFLLERYDSYLGCDAYWGMKDAGNPCFEEERKIRDDLASGNIKRILRHGWLVKDWLRDWNTFHNIPNETPFNAPFEESYLKHRDMWRSRKEYAFYASDEIKKRLYSNEKTNTI